MWSTAMCDDDEELYRGCRLFGSAEDCDAALRRGLSEEAGVWARLSTRAEVSDLAGVFICVFVAAVAAGMTIGFVSLDAINLRVKIRAGTEAEKRAARTLLPLVERKPRHQVLVTLLLLNSAANETLPLFLDNMLPVWAAVVVSVTALLFVGEILPSALFSGPSKLSIAASFAWPLRFLLAALAPLAWPLARCLDAALPEKPRYDSHQEIRALIDVQREAAAENGEVQPFTEDEADLVRGAMTLSTTSVRDCMVAIQGAFTLDSTASLDNETLQEIIDAGFSRVPVFERGVLTKYVLVKELLRLLIVKKQSVGDCRLYAPVFITPEHSLFELLNEFQTGSTHMAFVQVSGVVVGIVTLEDIIEVILTESIYDEKDLRAASLVLNRFLRHYVIPKLRGALLGRSSSGDLTAPLLAAAVPQQTSPLGRRRREKPPLFRARSVVQARYLLRSGSERRARRQLEARPRVAESSDNNNAAPEQHAEGHLRIDIATLRTVLRRQSSSAQS